MSILATYLLQGASGKKSIPYKVWVLNRTLSNGFFGPNDNIIVYTTYQNTPFTSTNSAGLSALNPFTNTIDWNQRYQIGNNSFSSNYSTDFSNVNYLPSQNKIYASVLFGSSALTGLAVFNSSGTLLQNYHPGYTSNPNNIWTTNLTDIYQSAVKYNSSTGINVTRYTITGQNTATTNWNGYWMGFGAASQLQPSHKGSTQYSGGPVMTLYTVYPTQYPTSDMSGILLNNATTGAGTWYVLSGSTTGTASPTYIDYPKTDSNQNYYMNKGRYAYTGTENVTGRLITSYDNSMNFRFAYRFSINGSNNNVNPILHDIDSSGNMYIVLTIQSSSSGTYSRIIKVSQEGTILWQYSINNKQIQSIKLHPTNPSVLLIVFNGGAVMTHRTSSLFTGTWSTYTIAVSSDVTLASVSDPNPPVLGTQGGNFNDIRWTSQATTAGIGTHTSTTGTVSINSTTNLV